MTLYSNYLNVLISKNFKESNNFEENFRSQVLNHLKSAKLVYRSKKLQDFNEIKVTPLGSFRIFGVKIDRKLNKFIHEYDMIRKASDLKFEERIKSIEKEVKSEKKMESVGKKLAEEILKEEKGESGEESKKSKIIG